MIDLKIPSPGESITEVQLATWLVANGDYVTKDQEIAEIDSDKATLSLSAEEAGIISFSAVEGDILKVGDTIAQIDTEAMPPITMTEDAPKATDTKTPVAPTPEKLITPSTPPQPPSIETDDLTSAIRITPLARRIMEEENTSPQELIAFYKGYKITQTELTTYNENKASLAKGNNNTPNRTIKRHPLSALRKKLAQRLVAVKNETAMLTTFNEVDMTAINKIRKDYGEAFENRHQVRLGLMSLFTRAVSIALTQFPRVNARLDKEEIIEHNYCDIGIAVSAPKGLMVPIIKDAEKLSLADIEHQIRHLAGKARHSKLTIEEMTGGTFTITNGGVFGSMLSTPIINPPQSAILAMHNIVDRPVVKNGQIVIAPVMYIALSYDHRIIDGKESVGFLQMIKHLIENPARILLNGQTIEEVILEL